MRDAEESLSSVFNPMSVAHAYEGGINGSQQFPRWLDDNLFHGATFRQLGPEHRPRVWINASDIFNRTPFVRAPGDGDQLFRLIATSRSD